MDPYKWWTKNPMKVQGSAAPSHTVRGMGPSSSDQLPKDEETGLPVEWREVGSLRVASSDDVTPGFPRWNALEPPFLCCWALSSRRTSTSAQDPEDANVGHATGWRG